MEPHEYFFSKHAYSESDYSAGESSLTLAGSQTDGDRRHRLNVIIEGKEGVCETMLQNPFASTENIYIMPSISSLSTISEAERSCAGDAPERKFVESMSQCFRDELSVSDVQSGLKRLFSEESNTSELSQ